MHTESEVSLSRDVDAVRIPSGDTCRLKSGTSVIITQNLGGTITLAVTGEGLYRIEAKDADAVGLSLPQESSVDASGPLNEDAVWSVLKTCYDPEIPVNIVDLGLIYSLELSDETDPNLRGKRVRVAMTLTAPGCGMGPTIAADAERKIRALPGVSSAIVEVVWDPPWNPSMISPAGREKLGIDS